MATRTAEEDADLATAARAREAALELLAMLERLTAPYADRYDRKEARALVARVRGAP